MQNWAILITVHDDPEQLRRFVDVMSLDNVWFYVHVDLKSDIGQFSDLRQMDRVIFIDKRVRVSWGGWSQVQATLNLIDAARASMNEFKYFTFASGNHYPLKSPQEIWDYYLSNGKEYLNIVSVPNITLQKRMDRFNTFNIDGAHRTKGFVSSVKGLIYRLLAKIPLRNVRKGLKGWKPYAGSNWWTLSGEAIADMADVIGKKKHLVNFFKYVRCPDESFFQTLLGNSRFLSSCVRADVYTDWSNPLEAPALIRMDHIPLITNKSFVISDGYGEGPAHFARKFSSKNAEVLNAVKDRFSRTDAG
jgi:Core-2/I-Branching enzyme